MNGILLIDKSEGWTSNDVVSKLRGILHERRIGHSGTLDPMATGLLVVFIGRSTRAVEFAERDAKRYTAALRLGISTDTQDITGKVLKQCEQKVSERRLEAVLESFRGTISQTPPMYSAIKVNGQRLYDIARRGGEVERSPRQITISKLEIVGREGGDFILDVACSKGTYIRTLCNDIGEALGCGGCMSSLRRTEAGRFGLGNAFTIEEVQKAADMGIVQGLMMPTDAMFFNYPEYEVSPEAEQKIRCGSPAKLKLYDGEYRLYSQSGEFLAFGRCERGVLSSIKSFFEV